MSKEIKLRCGQCPKFKSVSNFDHEGQRQEDLAAGKSLLNNPNINKKLKERLEDDQQTSNENVVYGNVPKKCCPIGTPVNSNRLCIRL
jgi:hypothetical protein